MTESPTQIFCVYSNDSPDKYQLSYIELCSKVPYFKNTRMIFKTLKKWDEGTYLACRGFCEDIDWPINNKQRKEFAKRDSLDQDMLDDLDDTTEQAYKRWYEYYGDMKNDLEYFDWEIGTALHCSDSVCENIFGQIRKKTIEAVWLPTFQQLLSFINKKINKSPHQILKEAFNHSDSSKSLETVLLDYYLNITNRQK